MITYRIDATDVRAHLYRVTLTVPTPAVEQRLSLPVWIPGSYLVREFARHLSSLVARQGGPELPVQQLDKATWRVTTDGKSELTIGYDVYAFDTSVRAAFLDVGRGFLNGTSLFLKVDGAEFGAHRVAMQALPDGWQIATTLRALDIDGAGWGVYEAPDYDELVDHPVELGRFWRGTFTAGGVPHEFVVSGALPDFDGDRLLADSARICAAQIAFWHGAAAPPFERYLFLLNAVEDGHGGLEHRASTALIAPRRDLPRKAEPAEKNAELSDGYVNLLGLISHEYFHAWNVKRLMPREFERYDYERENYTSLLWFFEGFTSYYDDLFLLRSGLIDESRYLKLVSRTVTNVLATPGRFAQSVAQASFDAWVKYYRNDENTPNATISYYAKGALVALALDLTLRAGGRGSLDDALRRLWAQSGGGLIDENDIAGALEASGGRSFAGELAEWVHGIGELPLRPLLEAAAVEWQSTPASVAQRLGVRVAESALTGVKVTHVFRGGAGEQAGLAGGDEILALRGWRIRRLDDAVRLLDGEAEAPLLVARDQRVLTLPLALPSAAASAAGAVALKPAAKPAADAHTRYKAWLAG